MKKIFSFIAACLLAVPTFAQFSSGGFSIDEEHTYWGIRLGVAFGGIGGDVEAEDGRTGMTLAGIVGLRVSETAPVFLETGLYYTERGGDKLKADGQALGHDGHLNYLEAPLLIKYGFGLENEVAVLPFLGPYVGMGISGNYKFLNHPEMGFKLGCGFEWSNLYAELAYQFGVTNLADGDEVKKVVSSMNDASSHGHALCFNIGINF